MTITEIRDGLISRLIGGVWSYDDLAHNRKVIAQALTTAVAEERERCAKVAESIKGGYTASLCDDLLVPDEDGPWALNSDIAAAIRKGVKG